MGSMALCGDFLSFLWRVACLAPFGYLRVPSWVPSFWWMVSLLDSVGGLPIVFRRFLVGWFLFGLHLCFGGFLVGLRFFGGFFIILLKGFFGVPPFSWRVPFWVPP